MKIEKHDFIKTIISTTLFFTLCIFSSCTKDGNADNYTISGNASGEQVVPPVAGNGAGSIAGTFNPNTRELTYTSNWSNLSGGPTVAAFYEGAAGVAGTQAGTNWTLDNTVIATSGTHAGATTLTEAQAAALIAGKFYYQYSTAATPTGEICGQIVATR